MNKNVFLSYSRRELGFVDDLTAELEKKDYSVWLDYRSLVPGSPWKEQIAAGIQKADVILLVVSKASIASDNVELEWRQMLKLKKRIILLIFEAVDLPKELEKFEWVDFRGSYKRGLEELFAQLATKEVQEEHPAPETGFKVPAVVWLAFALSLVVAGYSLVVFWTLLIPFLLLPLPLQIFRRSYDLTRLQTGLWMLPVGLIMTGLMVSADDPRGTKVISALFASLPFLVALFFVLRSRAMQRWAKEQGTLQRLAPGEDLAGTEAPRPVPFFIDHAPQDRRVASDLQAALVKAGHPQTDGIGKAKAVFVLLSRFKSDTSADPENQVVFPVILQTSAEIAPELGRVQWIDFRQGMRRLDAIARMLPDPNRLLRALGIRPRGRMLVLPPPVMRMLFFVVLLGVLTMATFMRFTWEVFSSEQFSLLNLDLFSASFGKFLGGLVLSGFLLVLLGRALVRRQGWLASFPAFSAALVALGLLYWNQFIESGQLAILFSQSGLDGQITLAFAAPLGIFVIGLVLQLALLGRTYRDIWHWFPARAK